ncbi:VTC domain-containing protein [Chloroflexota bacterium]
MISDILTPVEYRYERKFLISQLTRHELESIVRLHPAVFSEIFYQRTVNNIYFDSVSISGYQDNLNGLYQRMKIRIRWYDELFGFINEPVLELKIKQGLLGGKLRFPLAPFFFDHNYSLQLQQKVFTESNLPEILKEHLKSVKLTLLNHYQRKYFQSVDGKFRITLDFKVQSYRVYPFLNSFAENLTDSTNNILELKYSDKYEEEAGFITNNFPVRMTKSSKYVNGIEGLDASTI